MTDEAIQGYLSAALDQEACKKTLIAALESRVAQLQARGISDTRIIASLKHLSDEPFQMNDDVIEDVLESIILTKLCA